MRRVALDHLQRFGDVFESAVLLVVEEPHIAGRQTHREVEAPSLS